MQDIYRNLSYIYLNQNYNKSNIKNYKKSCCYERKNTIIGKKITMINNKDKLGF